MLHCGHRECGVNRVKLRCKVSWSHGDYPAAQAQARPRGIAVLQQYQKLSHDIFEIESGSESCITKRLMHRRVLASLLLYCGPCAPLLQE